MSAQGVAAQPPRFSAVGCSGCYAAPEGFTEFVTYPQKRFQSSEEANHSRLNMLICPLCACSTTVFFVILVRAQ